MVGYNFQNLGGPNTYFESKIQDLAFIIFKKFRLRRAFIIFIFSDSDFSRRFLLFSKKIRLRRAFIIFIFLKSDFLSRFLLFSKFLTEFPSAFIILLLRGGFIINTPVLRTQAN